MAGPTAGLASNYQAIVVTTGLTRLALRPHRGANVNVYGVPVPTLSPRRMATIRPSTHVSTIRTCCSSTPPEFGDTASVLHLWLRLVSSAPTATSGSVQSMSTASSSRKPADMDSPAMNATRNDRGEVIDQCIRDLQRRQQNDSPTSRQRKAVSARTPPTLSFRCRSLRKAPGRSSIQVALMPRQTAAVS